MTKIGVIGAMQVEIETIATHLANRQEIVVAGNRFFSGYLGSIAVVLTCSGIGKVNAAMAAQILVSVFSCDAILNTGIAGNLSDELHLGDFVVANKVVYHDMDKDILAQCGPFVSYFTPDAALCQHICQCLDGNVNYKVGTISTGDQFVEDEAVKRDIIARTGALCTEMEGGAIGHVAQKNGIPFAILRCLSDDADDAAVYDNFFEQAAMRSADITVRTIGLLGSDVI